jgi:hypothetical protein
MPPATNFAALEENEPGKFPLEFIAGLAGLGGRKRTLEFTAALATAIRVMLHFVPGQQFDSIRSTSLLKTPSS